MKISLSWLNEYVDVTLAPDALSNALTMAGLEVETVSDRLACLDDMVVGRITDVSPHPDADRLTLCSVNIGARDIRVVCGAPNVAKNMLCPVAIPGTTLPDGMVIKKSKIRGERSEGMLCSAAELGISGDHSGIMSLEGDIQPGEKISAALALSDMVFDIDITPNRADCLSVIGVAREVAAIEQTALTYPVIDSVKDALDTSEKSRPSISDIASVQDMASVQIDAPDLCPRYAAKVLEHVSVGPSPFWLKDRLLSVGMKPVNNMVDITNFVMMETGQPLHAFDLDRLAENRIVVRAAGEGDTFVTLDHTERTLSSDDLMICDGEKPVAIAGVMGGLNSEIESSTTRVLIESAYFSPASIRKTSKRLALNTESAYRFERGCDPEGTLTALDRAADLMAELGGGRLATGTIDECPKPFHRAPIHLSVRESNRLLGTELTSDAIQKLLESIGFAVKKEKKDDDAFVVTPPSWRVDMERPVDLMEEVARLSGYDAIPATLPTLSGEARLPQKGRDTRKAIRSLMAGFGFSEAITYSFISSDSCDRLRMAEKDPGRHAVVILNPLSAQQAVMRTTLAHNLFETVARNMSRRSTDLKLFEIGKTFVASGDDALPDDALPPDLLPPDLLPKETETLFCVQTGVRQERAWNRKEVDCDFYDMKGIAEGLFQGLRVDNVAFSALPDPLCGYVKNGHAAAITLNGKQIGLVGEANPEVLNAYDISRPVFIFEINIDILTAAVPDAIAALSLPTFPAVSRDITVIIDRDVETGRILEAIRAFPEELTEDVRVFDVFTGSPIPEGKVSATFRLTYRSDHRTLSDAEATRINKKITDRLMDAFDADLPA